MIKVAIIRSNSVERDPKIIKLYTSLSKKYNVLILGWDRIGHFRSYKLVNNMRIHYYKLITPYGPIFRRIAPTLLFSLWVLINLIKYRPKIVHACDVDTVMPSYIYSVLTKNMMIFDLRDRFSLSITKPKIIIFILRVLEEYFSCRADLFMTNSIILYNTFVSKPKNYTIIMNCPKDKIKTEKRGKSSSQCFKLVYAGYITPERGLELVAKSLSELNNVKLVIAGETSSHVYLKRLEKYPNVEYIGILSYEEAINLQWSADAIVIPYDPQLPMNRIGTPNKLFDAMMLSVPVITTICKGLVQETGCGLYVSFDVDSLRSAIMCLKNDLSLREKMGVNGRKAFEHKYNWNIMEKKLFNQYENLLKKGKKNPF